MKNLRLPLAEEPPRGPRSTPIEWTDATWNPVAGCKEISPGCANCYAARITWRLMHNPRMPLYKGLARLDAKGKPRFTGEARFLSDRLDEPLRWRKPRTIFVNSMSDLFHEDVTFEQIAAVMGVIAATERHTYQVLTKRAERLPLWFDWAVSMDAGCEGTPGLLCCCSEALLHEAKRHADGDAGPLHTKHAASPDGPWPLPNLWLGVSVENRQQLARIEHLRRTPAAVRFLSIEPLLEDLGDILAILMGLREVCGTCRRGESRSCFDDPANRIGPPIDWVIVGGEGGPGARPMHPDWVRSIRDQCIKAGVPFFFKQWGGVRKKSAGRILDGRTWDEMPRRS